MSETQKLDTVVTPPGAFNAAVAAQSCDAVKSPSAASAPIEETVAGVEIAGYELLEKLGSGGYGEVWKAIGPGGLPKAVKILFGEKSGQHAAVELKALQRMRELRHPFLLSIERIEIVNNRLIVVTELADRNLSDRFDECRREGQVGIARDCLLGYMTDAADALDYMYEQHGLQHLDIKPDNILLQGDRAKVGDFGLAKDISRSEVSMLNGFTPMYAAPELFEGNPGVGSDQYSMAMMYTMMLTGKLPFTGRTPAQLMSQHMKSPPDLSALQPIDRPVVARALSKNANARFDSNRAFVEELSRRKAARTVRPLRMVNSPIDDPKTELVDNAEGANLVRRDQKPSEPRSHTPPPVAADTKLRTSVVIGIGGLAAQALQQLKHNLNPQDGPSAPSDLPILLIDSDRDALNAAKASGRLPALTPEETLHLPLKKSKEYKQNKNLDLSWLSRRWLFNIPRSGNVDGIRPLGRLVLADHQDKVRASMKRLLLHASSEAAAETISKHTQLPVESTAIDVYVVASSTGGTSSGMVADVGLMLQSVARRSKLVDVNIHCVLLHGTGIIRTTADVQEANTLSLLKELRHLLTPGLGSPRGFTADQHSLDDCPFHSCRMVPLGDGESESTLSQKAQQVGRFLFDISTTAAQLDFHDWKQQQALSTLGPGCLQLLGMDQQNAANVMSASAEASSLSGTLLRHWVDAVRTPPAEADRTLPTEETRLLLSNLNLTQETLPPQIMSILQGETGQEVQACSDELLETIRSQSDGQPMNQSQLIEAITATGFRSSSDPQQKTVVGIVNEVSAILETARGHASDILSKHLNQILDSPGRLTAMQIAGNVARQELADTSAVCTRMRERIETAFAELTENASAELTISDEEALDQCRQYCTLMAWQLVYRCFIDHLDGLKAFVQEEMASLNSLIQSLCEIAEKAEANSPETDEPKPKIEDDLIHEFDRFLRGVKEDLLSKHALNKKAKPSTLNELTAVAQQFLLAATDNNDDAAPVGLKKQFPATAWPRIGGIGGIRRVLGLIPEELDAADWRKRLRQEFDDCVGLRQQPGSHLSVYCELDEVPFESVINTLCYNRSHLQEVASRVHTRIDIDW